MARQRWARDWRDEDQCCTPPLWFCSLSSWWPLATSAVCSAGCKQPRSPGAHPAGSTTGMVPRGRGFTGTSPGSTLKCFVLGSLVQHSRSVYGCAGLIHEYRSVHFLIIFVSLTCCSQKQRVHPDQNAMVICVLRFLFCCYWKWTRAFYLGQRKR